MFDVDPGNQQRLLPGFPGLPVEQGVGTITAFEKRAEDVVGAPLEREIAGGNVGHVARVAPWNRAAEFAEVERPSGDTRRIGDPNGSPNNPVAPFTAIVRIQNLLHPIRVGKTIGVHKRDQFRIGMQKGQVPRITGKQPGFGTDERYAREAFGNQGRGSIGGTIDHQDRETGHALAREGGHTTMDSLSRLIADNDNS